MTGLRTILIVPRTGVPVRAVAGALASLAVVVALVGCSSDDEASSAGGGPRIVVTTDVLGDVVSEFAGSDAEVVVLMPDGADPHSFEPSARQVARLEAADLVVAGGLGLEAGLGPVLDRVADDGVDVLEVAPLVDPIPLGTEESDDGHDHGTDDPHFWLDPLRMGRAVEVIAARLDELDPDTDWVSRARDEAASFEALDGEVEALLSAVPAEDRLLATDHDAFGYFADRYGFEVVGVVTPGGSTLAETSASDLNALVEKIESAGVAAIFVGSTASDTLADAVAREIGDDVEVVEVRTGSLDGERYRELLLTNARRISEALAPAGSP